MIKKDILGIIAEYDPFHNGHNAHMKKARLAVHPDTVYTVLSPCIKQRGTLSMFSPLDRAACAIRAGSDAVFMLPVLWTVRDADHYAFGAVYLMQQLGVTHLAFGAECPDSALLSEIAALLENPSALFNQELKAQLGRGKGYPFSVSLAAEKCIPGSSVILSRPNNILAVCYFRALRRLQSSIIPVVIPRTGDDHDLMLNPVSPSASSLRGYLQRGAYLQAEMSMPPFTLPIIRKSLIDGRVPDPNIWNAMLSSRLRTADTSHLPDLSEGIENRIAKVLSSTCSPSDMISRISGRRYSAARISRLFAMLMLDVDQQRISSLKPPDNTLLLGLRRKSALTERWRDLSVRISKSPAEWRTYAAREDIVAWRLWSAACGLPDSFPYSERIYTE